MCCCCEGCPILRQIYAWHKEVCAKVNNWNEEEIANQLILYMKKKTHVVMSQLLSQDKNSYERMVKALRENIRMHQVPEAAKDTLKA